MARRVPLLVLLSVLVFVAAMVPSTLLCHADTQQDVATVRDILTQLETIENDPDGGDERFAVSTVWQYMLTLDTMRQDEDVWMALTSDERQQVDRYHSLYTRDSCLVKLHNRVQDHMYKATGGEERYYYDLEWESISALVEQYVAQIDSKSEADMKSDLDQLFAAIEQFPSREDLYADWCELVEEQIRAVDTALFDRVDAMRKALGLAEGPRYVFFVSFAQDYLDSWDTYVATYVADSEDILDFYHIAYYATLASSVRATPHQIASIWQGYDVMVASVNAVNVSTQDAQLLADKAALRDYIARALQSEPIASYTGEKWQYYADLARQCDLALDEAVTTQDVAVISSFYRPLFVVETVKKKQDNTQWWLLGVSLGVALVCFVVYFFLKKRNPTVKTERQSAEQFLVELQNMGKKKELSPAQDGAVPDADTSDGDNEIASRQQDATSIAEDSTSQQSQGDNVAHTEDLASDAIAEEHIDPQGEEEQDTPLVPDKGEQHE